MYAIFKQRLGTVEFRANRLLTGYAFFLVYITLFIALFLISARILPFEQSPIASSLLVSILFVTIATASRRHFEALVARVIHRIHYSQEEILGLFAERLPTAFDHHRLVRIIQEEILPTLLVRQSALYLFEEDRLQALYEQGLQDDEKLSSSDALAPLLARSGEYVDTLERHEQAPWVRLAVPVALQNKTIGVWLFGKRDPDDFYPVSDIILLSKLANQIAPVVENANLFEQAQQEIAHRRKAEEEIRQSNERFKNLFEATLEGIAVVRDGTILEVNRALCDMLGYSAAQLIGRPLSEFVVEGLEPAHHQPIGADALLPAEGVAVNQDGKRFDIELAIKGYLYQGEQVNVVAIRDITQRKRDQTEKEKLQRQLLQAQKMEAIGRLTAGLAHDFNNLLTGILGYSNLILDRNPSDKRLYNDLLEVKKAGEKAAALTKQMLAFSRQQLMSPKVLNLNTVLAGLKNLLARTLGEDVELSVHFDPVLAPVKIDPVQIEQVILNLAVNSRDAMPGGGKLRIETSTVVIEAPVAKYPSLPPGKYVLLAISDTGVGISSEVKAHMFEPFFTTKEIGRGTGLGLSTVYGIVKQSSGYVYADSELGQGTTFNIYLPPAAEIEKIEEVEEEQPLVTALRANGTETILLVEDEDVVRVLTTTLLRDNGYRVLDAANANEALRICKNFKEPIDLLLTDVTMPGMSGPQLAHQLCSVRPKLKVVYMSGYSNETAFGDEVLRSKAVLLQKPFPPDVLSRKLREILDAR
ncbi:MAG TPA: ATP-binding protein [Dehalococcoidia bacterium]|nr:ATP-binding protein [Dehalococcoidia bacterium]